MGGFEFTGPTYVFKSIQDSDEDGCYESCDCSPYHKNVDAVVEAKLLTKRILDLSEDLPDFPKDTHMCGYTVYKRVLREPTKLEKHFGVTD